MAQSRGGVRRFLDGLYFTGGMIGAGFLLLILLIIVAQMVARWTGHVLPGSTAYAGYCMAAASFFSLAYALNHGAHIRVTLLLSKMGRWQRLGEVWCFAVATFFSGYFAWFAWKNIQVSHMINDISQGQDATPLWIPQIAMGIGTTLLFIAFVDNLYRITIIGEHGIEAEKVTAAGVE
ncbi:MAG: TRAP transporter small permease [Proteobacteria bacterium]|nr:TRAP transporter small permease [Pseudomonadota bacterium]